MANQTEEYRVQMLRYLEEKYNRAKPTEVLEAEKAIAKYREGEARAREAILRLRKPIPNPNACPRCYYLRGKITQVLPALSGDPDSEKFQCPSCGYPEDQKPD